MLLETDQDLVLMRKQYTWDFLNVYKSGFKLY